MTDIYDRQQEIETFAFATKGVVGVGIGLSKTGLPCIKIYTDSKLNQASIPKQLIAADIEFEYSGDISAQ